MDNEVIELSEKVDKLSYENKAHIYQRVFSLGYLASEDMNDRLILISLGALVFKQMKLKDSTVTPLKILLQITKQPVDNTAYYRFLEALAIIIEDFSYGIKKIDPCGLKTSQEIINKIKELLSTWMPF